MLKTKKRAKITENFYHDFKIRWNTTFIMIDRALKLKVIINDITHNSESIPNLNVSQKMLYFCFKMPILYINFIFNFILTSEYSKGKIKSIKYKYK